MTDELMEPARADDPPPAFEDDQMPAPGDAEPVVPHELTEAGLEALLFVAERPLTRREIDRKSVV